MKLYELTTSYRQVSEMIEDGETELLLDTLESINCAIEAKAESICRVNVKVTAEIAAIDAEIKRLQQRKQVMQNGKASLLDYLKNQLEAIGETKVSGTLFTVSIKKNPPALQVYDEGQLPAEYWTIVPQTLELNKAKVKEALKNGKQLNGVRLTQGTSLTIK